MCVLRSIGDLWQSHHQMTVVLVDKLLKTQVIECAAVANWIFSKEMVHEFTKLYIWEMLHLTIRYDVQSMNYFRWRVMYVSSLQEDEQTREQIE